MGNIWEGPVLRADVKPFDTETWDEYRKENPGEYIGGMPPCRTWNSGIYALDTKEYAIETAHLYQLQILGEVDLWGRVVVFDRGYRAELCMIKKLWILYRGTDKEYLDLANSLIPGTAAKKLMPDLARTYDCDVEIL